MTRNTGGSERRTIADAMTQLSEIAGRKVSYQPLPPEQAETAFGHDFAEMFRWFREEGYHVDIDRVRKQGVRLTTFKDHLAGADWVKRV